LAEITGMSVPSIPSTVPPTVPSATDTSAAGNFNLTPSDFMNMMVTQLQNQDPTQPMSNSDLLSQISEIGQLQSSDSLQTTMSSLQLQTNLGSGAALLGKSVQGTDSNSNPVSGIVNSLQITTNAVTLQLDNGNSLPLANVTNVSPAPASTTSTTTPVSN
jgi:flagellar basal-body rod modification protein FlgD